MTRTTPRRRTILHLSQTFLTLGRTFMASLVAVGDSSAAGVVRAHLHGDPIAGEDADVELAHPPADRRENDQAVVTFDAKHRVRERFLDDAVELQLVALRLFSLAAFTHKRFSLSNPFLLYCFRTLLPRAAST